MYLKESKNKMQLGKGFNQFLEVYTILRVIFWDILGAQSQADNNLEP